MLSRHGLHRRRWLTRLWPWLVQGMQCVVWPGAVYQVTYPIPSGSRDAVKASMLSHALTLRTPTPALAGLLRSQSTHLVCSTSLVMPHSILPSINSLVFHRSSHGFTWLGWIMYVPLPQLCLAWLLNSHGTSPHLVYSTSLVIP
jgi:hypothetical protein